MSYNYLIRKGSTIKINGFPVAVENDTFIISETDLEKTDSMISGMEIVSGQNTQNLNFGRAIAALKDGKSIRRAGWNGKGMSLLLNRGSMDINLLGFKGMDHPSYPHGSQIDGVDIGLFNLGDAGTTTRLPNINMITATGSIVTGWLASQTDMLAEDWEIIE